MKIGNGKSLPGRAVLVLALDLLFCAVSWPAALIVRVNDLDFTGTLHFLDSLWFAIPATVIVCAAVFYIAGLYRTFWRYVSLRDVLEIAKAVALALAIVALLLFLTNRLHSVPRSVPLIQYLLLVVFMSGTRIAYSRILCQLQRRRERGLWHIPTLLVGVGKDAELFVQATQSDPKAPYKVVALLDPDGEHVGRAIHGVPVMGDINEFQIVVQVLSKRKIRPQRLLISQFSNKIDTSGLVSAAKAAGMAVAYLPPMTHLTRLPGHALPPASEFVAQDLLRRPAVPLTDLDLCSMVMGRRLLVTGAGGSIGAELCRQIAPNGPAEMVLLENSEFNLYSINLDLSERHPDLKLRAKLCDVRRRDVVMRIFDECKPDLIFHTAALKHVPLSEINAGETVLTNAIGTRNVADAAVNCGALAMVQISTDKAVNPTSIMGASKRLAELYVQALDFAEMNVDVSRRPTRFVTVRFGNVLASSGSVVQLFERQLRKGGPLTVTHPQIKRFFMTIDEAVALVLRASAYGILSNRDRGRILVLDMGPPVKIVDIARQMIRLAGYKDGEDIRIEFTGLRPGEKLEEELFDDLEVVKGTEVPGIFSAHVAPLQLNDIRHFLDRLSIIAIAGEVDELRRSVASFLPGSCIRVDSDIDASAEASHVALKA